MAANNLDEYDELIDFDGEPPVHTARNCVCGVRYSFSINDEGMITTHMGHQAIGTDT